MACQLRIQIVYRPEIQYELSEIRQVNTNLDIISNLLRPCSRPSPPHP